MSGKRSSGGLSQGADTLVCGCGRIVYSISRSVPATRGKVANTLIGGFSTLPVPKYCINLSCAIHHLAVALDFLKFLPECIFHLPPHSYRLRLLAVINILPTESLSLLDVVLEH